MIILSSVVISTARFFIISNVNYVNNYADRMKLFSSLHNELKSVPWLAAMPVN